MIVVEVAIGVLVTLALTWILLMVGLAVFRPHGINLAEAKRLVPDVAHLVKDLSTDKSLPKSVRRRLVFVAAYLALPIDIVPDFIPVLGYADDVIVLAWGLRSAVRHAGPQALERLWRGTATGLAVVRSLAGISSP
jgi:uncharacterized membrane protein YkvA (DUF1232 family)